jgi:DNA-binding SARP family transcriptional activator/tetratricopeptide (TPR) repeat protein
MVTLLTLGTIELRDDRGDEIRPVLVQPRRLALLACLALTRPRGFQRRDRLVTLFWADDDTDRSRAALNRAVYFIRRALGDGIVISRGSEELGIDRDRFWSDAEGFEAALDAGDFRGALELYRGDLLPGFFVAGAPGFEEWLEGERARLNARATEAARSLLEEADAVGHLPMAVQWARRLLELSPLDEAAVRRLIVLLDRTGDRAGATTAYRHFAGELALHLGLEPASETRALIEGIRSHHVEGNAEPHDAGDRDPSFIGAHVSRSELRIRPVHGAPSDPDQGERTTPPANTRRRVAHMAALITVAGLAAALIGEWPESTDPYRIDVSPFENRTGDPAFDRVSRITPNRVVKGLVQAGVVRTAPGAPDRVAWLYELAADSVVVRSRRVRGRAGTLISGAYEREAGTVRIRAWITDHRRGDRVWTVTPASGPVGSPERILRTVQQHIAGGVAVLSNPYDASLLPAATSPPRVEAYREFREGLRLQATTDREEAMRHFRLAVAIDSTFTWPLVHAALSGIMQPRAEKVDTLLQELTEADDRLGALERHLVEYLQAIRVNDWEGSYRAISKAAELAPDQFSYLQAIRALDLQRPREAVAALTRPHLDSIYRESGRNYWFVLTLSYHQLSEHRRELAAVRTARRSLPSNASLLVQELRGLAALGRRAAIEARLDTLVALPRDGWLDAGKALMQVALELRTHGHEEAALKVLSRGIAWYKSRPDLEANTEVQRFFLAWTLDLAGQLDAAETMFRALNREHPHNVDYLGHLGALAARRGDVTTARRFSDSLSDRDAAAPVPGEESIVWRARIAALLGEKEAAMHLLIDAFGPQGTTELHNNSDFDGMRSYPPFREFVRPKG